MNHHAVNTPAQRTMSATAHREREAWRLVCSELRQHGIDLNAKKSTASLVKAIRQWADAQANLMIEMETT